MFFFIFVTETSSWAYFKDNFALIKKIKTCVALKWILYTLWAYLIYYMLHIWQIGAYAKICVIDMFFWSVYVQIDTLTANEVKKQRKKYYKYLWPGTRSSKTLKKHKNVDIWGYIYILGWFIWTKCFCITYFCFFNYANISKKKFKKKKLKKIFLDPSRIASKSQKNYFETN